METSKDPLETPGERRFTITVFNSGPSHHETVDMPITRFLGSIALILLICPMPATAAGWDDYKPYSIARMKADQAGVNEDMDFHFTPGIPFRSTVRYLGRTRAIQAERLIFIEMWAQSHRMSSIIVEAFEKEILVREDRKSYWLPIQSVLIPHIEKEVEENANVTLFLVFAGAIKDDQVFLVNEFKAR